MPHFVEYTLGKILIAILETDEAQNSKITFELSQLQAEAIISEITGSTNVNTIHQYWKQLFWKNLAISQFRKRNEILQRNAYFGVFDKKACEEIIKNFKGRD